LSKLQDCWLEVFRFLRADRFLSGLQSPHLARSFGRPADHRILFLPQRLWSILLLLCDAIRTVNRALLRLLPINAVYFFGGRSNRKIGFSIEKEFQQRI